MAARKRWTEEEDNRLREMFLGKATVGQIARAMGRGKDSVQCRISAMNLKRPRSDAWTEEQTAMLRDMYAAGATIKEMISGIGRTRHSILSQMFFLGLHRDRWSAWSEQELDTLQRLWGEGLSARDISSHLPRSPSAVLTKAKEIGLRSRASAREHRPGEQQVCKACLIKLEFAANCPVSKCPNFTGYVEPYERTLAGVSGGWVANG